MIERIIENWLTNASERSFQLPFCYLLVQEGYTIIHLTRHCGMEYGKDIIAIDPDGIPCGFQLKDVKGGKYKLRDWQDNINQVYQTVYTPLSHPSLPLHERHRSILVLNGEIEEEAFTAIHLQNENWQRQQQPYRIEVIVKGQMLEKAIRYKDQFVPTELLDFKALLEFRIDSGEQFLDKKKFSDLLSAVIQKQGLSKEGQKRAFSGGALLCALALSNYTEKQNHWAVIEGWTIYQAQLLGYCERSDASIAVCREEIKLAEEIITNSLIDLCDEVRRHDFLFVGHPNQDAFVYKYRVTILMGLMGYLGIKKFLSPDLEVRPEDINDILSKYAKDMIIWGEAAIPFYLCVYWFYKVHREQEVCEDLLTSVLNTIIGMINTPAIIFPDLYYDAEEAILLRFTGPEEQVKGMAHRGSSYTVEAIVHLAALDNMRTVLAERWNLISKLQYEYFEMTNPSDFYQWRIAKGQHVIRNPHETERWSELQTSAKMVDEKKLPMSLQSVPNLTPLFLMVYPHRFTRDIVLWANTFLSEKISKT